MQNPSDRTQNTELALSGAKECKMQQVRRTNHAIRKWLFPVFCCLPFAVAFLIVLVASAQGGGTGTATPNDVNRVAKQLYCPVCPNTPLDVCETQACQDWRELIRQKLSTGESDQQIVNYFVAQYGQRVLAQPTAKGFNLLVWLMPAIVLIAGLAALVVILRSWVAKRIARVPVSISAPEPDELPAEYVARIELELRLRGR